MFGTKESVIDTLESLIEQLKNDDIRVTNTTTEGGIWVDGECVQLSITLSFMSNGYEEEEINDDGKEEIGEELNRAYEDAECGCD